MHVSFTGAGRDALDLALARAEATGPHWKPLFLAARDERCGLMMVVQSPGRFEVPDDCPHIVVIGDDMAQALGPPGFHLRSLRRYLRRCAAVIVMSGAPVAAIYAAGARRATQDRRNVALIETRVEQEAEWMAFVLDAAPGVNLHLASPSVALPGLGG